MEEVQNSSYQNKNLKGIEIIPNKQGIDRFRVRIRKKGHKEFSKTYRTKTLAQKNKNRIESEMENAQIDFKPVGRQMFKDPVDRYVETVLPQFFYCHHFFIMLVLFLPSCKAFLFRFFTKPPFCI